MDSFRSSWGHEVTCSTFRMHFIFKERSVLIKRLHEPVCSAIGLKQSSLHVQRNVTVCYRSVTRTTFVDRSRNSEPLRAVQWHNVMKPWEAWGSSTLYHFNPYLTGNTSSTALAPSFAISSAAEAAHSYETSTNFCLKSLKRNEMFLYT
jgi:hypothetical protein